MTAGVQQALIDFIEQRAEQIHAENIAITWYGGEPLLVKDTVVSLSRKIGEFAKNCGMTAQFSIITNGYLIDKSITEQLYDCGIRMAQITVDGCEERHNKRRFLKAAPEQGTYMQILQGINIFAQQGITVCVRMNVDKENIGDVGTFVQDMKARIADTQNIMITLGHVFDMDDNSMSYESDNCLSTERFAECKLTALQLFKELGLVKSLQYAYPRPRSTFCAGIKENSFTVRPDGKLYRCWNDLSTDSLSIGSIFEPLDTNADQYKKWSECPSVFDNKKCWSCEVLPLCMGGCPREQVYSGKDADCIDVKHNINRLIDFFAINKLFE
jgi:uncharacterized protein